MSTQITFTSLFPLFFLQDARVGGGWRREEPVAVFSFNVFSAPVLRPLAEYAERRHTGRRVREHRAANAAYTTVETSHNASTPTSCATLDACPSAHHRPLLAGKQRIRSPPPIRPPLPTYGPELQPPLHPETTPPLRSLQRKQARKITSEERSKTDKRNRSINAMLSLSILLLLLELSRSKKRQHGGVVLGTAAAATHLTRKQARKITSEERSKADKRNRSINAMLSLSLSILLLLLELSRSKKRQHGGVVLGTAAAATHLTVVAAAAAHLAAHDAERGQGPAAGRWWGRWSRRYGRGEGLSRTGTGASITGWVPAAGRGASMASLKVSMNGGGLWWRSEAEGKFSAWEKKREKKRKESKKENVTLTCGSHVLSQPVGPSQSAMSAKPSLKPLRELYCTGFNS
uniref:Uncharacterized protein n=1 Tax=Oryza meridionalis TaxID=40149 RepID=A0A0E0CD36_9ORYZ